MYDVAVILPVSSTTKTKPKESSSTMLEREDRHKFPVSNFRNVVMRSGCYAKMHQSQVALSLPNPDNYIPSRSSHCRCFIWMDEVINPRPERQRVVIQVCRSKMTHVCQTTFPLKRFKCSREDIVLWRH
jgi:hypothetical protein